MAKRQQRDLYRGKATIISVYFEGVEDWQDWEKKNLPERDIENAFKIVYAVAEGGADGARHEVKVECSHRELGGEMLTYYKREDGAIPTQMDVAIRSLVKQGLLARGAQEANIAEATDDALVGREVKIRAYEELGNDGETWWPRCTFCSASQMISGADKEARIAAFLAGKPATKTKAATAPTKAAAIPTAPAEDVDPDDPPF